jgi:tetratricopeptide (TPR) repeat protein
MTNNSSNTTGAQQEARKAAAEGATFFGQGRYPEAVAQLQKAVQLWPTHPDLHYNLACAAWAVNDLKAVRSHLLETLNLDPRYAKAHDALARLHLGANELAIADQLTATAVGLAPTEAEFRLTRGLVLEAQGNCQGAWEAVEAVVGAPPVADRVAALRARLAPRLGRKSQAIDEVMAALAAPVGEARFRRQLHFAAAGLLDRMQRYTEAFEQARRAHTILRPPYDAIQRQAEIERRIEYWTADRVRSQSRATHASRRPLFIVGMPRSGTSLIEQILACHSRVFGAGELDALGRSATMLDSTGLPYPRSLETLSPAAANQIGGAYLAAIAALDSRADYVTDKMPLNFAYLDLVEVLLPHSRVIHCMRDPLDNCLSCFITDFAVPYDFASDLRSLGGFYRLHERLMNHWKQVLSIAILEVKYEDVVENLEGQARRMLEFLKLPWDPKCLDFHANPRHVATASRDQVRRPLYSSSVGRWKHYEPQLSELIEALRQYPPRVLATPSRDP